MKIQEVENMTFEEIKGQKDAIVEGLKDVPHEELLGRYVQARCDAKQRDVSQATQATTLDLLQSSLNDLTEQRDHFKALAEKMELQINSGNKLLETYKQNSIDDKKDSAAKLAETVGSLNTKHAEKVKAMGDTIAELTESLAVEKSRANRFKALATAHANSMSQIAKLSSDSLTAQQVDNTEGE